MMHAIRGFVMANSSRMSISRSFTSTTKEYLRAFGELRRVCITFWGFRKRRASEVRPALGESKLLFCGESGSVRGVNYLQRYVFDECVFLVAKEGSKL